jgi:hypothetical protein
MLIYFANSNTDINSLCSIYQEDIYKMLTTHSIITMTWKERFMIFVPLILVIAFISFFFTCKNTSRSDFEKYVVPTLYEGVIVKKYLKEYGHGATIIEIKNSNGIEKLEASDWINLYDLCNIGDSIYKKAYDRTIKLVKKDSIIELQYYLNEHGFGISKIDY